MKKFILAFVMSFIMCASAFGNEVYINQSGSGLDLDITIDGAGSKVGASDDVTQIIPKTQNYPFEVKLAMNQLQCLYLPKI